MASIQIRLKRRPNKNGECPLSIILKHEGDRKEIGCNVSVKEAHWSTGKEEVKKNDKNHRVKNTKLKQKRNALDKAISLLELNADYFSINDIVTKSGLNKNKVEKEKKRHQGIDLSTITIVKYLEKYIKENPMGLKYNTLKYYTTTLNNLKGFKKLNIPFSEFDLKTLKHFEHYLEEDCGLKVNTIYTRHKVLKKICKHVISEGHYFKNPYDKIKLKTEESNRSRLTIEEIGKMKSYKPRTEAEKLIRDVFIFSIYSGGLRFGDICTLKVSEITRRKVEGKEECRLNKMIRKTKKKNTGLLGSQAVEIMDSYCDFNDVSKYVFPIINTTTKNDIELSKIISSRNAYYNKVIKKICKRSEIEKNVSMHVARHTFATLSLRKGIPVEVIQNVLGHANIKETQIYAKVVSELTDEAIMKFNEI